MRAIMKSLALLIAGGVALALSAAPVRAMPVPPVWTYFATSCLGCGGLVGNSEVSVSFSPPRALATFSSPDRSGTYSFYEFETPTNTPPIIIVSGDDNFFFSWATDPVIFIPRPFFNCFQFGVSGCGWTVTWDQSASGLSIGVMFGDGLTGMRLTNTFVLFAGSDSETGNPPPCDLDSFSYSCTFTGYWTTSSVPLPEPSSLVGLASAILGFFVILLRREQAEPLRRNPPGDHRTHRKLARKLRV